MGKEEVLRKNQRASSTEHGVAASLWHFAKKYPDLPLKKAALKSYVRDIEEINENTATVISFAAGTKSYLTWKLVASREIRYVSSRNTQRN